MRLVPRPRRVVAPMLVAALGLLTLGLAACGGSNADLQVSVKPLSPKQQARPGSDASYVATVLNNGPGATTGVTVRLDLPTAFRYETTTSIDTQGPTTRTQPTDPVVQTATPQWGQWSMGAPGINADGTPAHSTLTITFTVRAAGKPDDYSITPHVFNDSGDDVVGKDLTVHLYPASDLSITIDVDEPSAKRGDTLHFHVLVLNRGSGVAKDVGILITLPSAVVYDHTEHIVGNFSRNNSIDPANGALLVYYGGYNLPAAGESRPGTLAFVMVAKVLPTAQAGRVTASAQLTDAGGAVVSVDNVAGVIISAPSTPSPSPSASGSPHFYYRPSPSPMPSPTRKSGG